MRCSRCGKENPESLRFCQDCGNRLISGEVAGVAPTPPRGLAPAAKPAAPAPLGAQTPPPGAAGPVAPPFFAPPATFAAPPAVTGAGRVSEAPMRPAAPQFEFSPQRPPERVCTRCGTSNPPNGRFCSNCGGSLERPHEPSTAPHAAPPRPGVGAAAQPATRQFVATPAPVSTTLTCSRCRGPNPPQMSFCQFCGARLAAGPEETRPAAYAVAPTHASPQHHAPPEPKLDARLVVIGQDGKPGRDYPIVDDQTDIGREEGNIVLPNDPYVGARHARLTRRNGRFFVRDLESVNGVYVRLRSAERLQHGDLVLIGLEVLRFEVVSDAEKGLSPAVERGTQIFGSPSAARHMRLCQRTVEGVTRDVYYPTRDEAVVGREQGDIVFTNDPFMSRRHAAITRDPNTGTFSLRDLGSSNGTYLAIRSERELTPGDHVRIGQHLFRLDVGRADGR